MKRLLLLAPLLAVFIPVQASTTTHSLFPDRRVLFQHRRQLNVTIPTVPVVGGGGGGQTTTAPAASSTTPQVLPSSSTTDPVSTSTTTSSIASTLTSSSSSSSLTRTSSVSGTRTASSSSSANSTSSSSSATSTVSGVAGSSQSGDSNSSNSSGLSGGALIGVIVAASVLGLMALIWTIVRKTAFSPSKRFESRLKPIQFDGVNGFGKRDGRLNEEEAFEVPLRPVGGASEEGRGTPTGSLRGGYARGGELGEEDLGGRGAAGDGYYTAPPYNPHAGYNSPPPPSNWGGSTVVSNNNASGYYPPTNPQQKRYSSGGYTNLVNSPNAEANPTTLHRPQESYASSSAGGGGFGYPPFQQQQQHQYQ